VGLVEIVAFKKFGFLLDLEQGELIFTLLACESDASSMFRKLLVTELVPTILQLSKNLTPSPTFVTLLDQCIEYHVLAGEKDSKDVGDR
jgi:hypothetical protein